MYRYLLTFSVLHDIPEGIAIDVRYLLDPRKYVEFLEPRDIAIVPSSNFSDIESQRKILILIKRNELYSDYGVRKFCSEVTIAGYLYNCFKSNLQKDQEYYKKRDGFYDMFTILDEVNFARNKGLGIFNELADAEKHLHKKLSDLKAKNHGKFATEPTVYKEFKTQIALLLKYYEDDVKDKLVKMLKGNDLIRYCNNEYLFSNNIIYKCYQISDFSFTLKHIDDFYNDSFGEFFDKLSINLNLLRNEFYDNCLLYLGKWLSTGVKHRKADLFTSVINLLDKFYAEAEFLCNRHNDFDTMFYWFDCLMRDINQKIVDSFDNKECVLYYGDLKRELVNDKRVQEIFSKIYNKFSLTLLNNFFSKEQYSNEVLKSFFFSADTVIGKGQTDQKYDLHAISRLLIEMNYDWMKTITLETLTVPIHRCRYYSSSKHYKVDLTMYHKGVLQILKYNNTHKYVCDYIEEKNILKNDNIFFKKYLDKFLPVNDATCEYGDYYIVPSERIVLFYDSFYIYFEVNGNIKLKIHHKVVFPSIDVAVLTLACHVFRIKKIV